MTLTPQYWGRKFWSVVLSDATQYQMKNGDIDVMIDGSEEIIKRLKEYLPEFDKYGYPVCWGTEEFVNYLNDIILRDSDEKVIILKLWTDDYDENLPTLRI